MHFVGFRSGNTAYAVRPDRVTHLEANLANETVINFVGGHSITVDGKLKDVLTKIRAESSPPPF